MVLRLLVHVQHHLLEVVHLFRLYSRLLGLFFEFLCFFCLVYEFLQLFNWKSLQFDKLCRTFCVCLSQQFLKPLDKLLFPKTFYGGLFLRERFRFRSFFCHLRYFCLYALLCFLYFIWNLLAFEPARGDNFNLLCLNQRVVKGLQIVSDLFL